VNPIYIPSRGRATTCSTASHLQDAGIPFHFAVEPQDVESYAVTWGSHRVLALPESNRGIAFSRTWIKQYSVSRGELHHWQIDDNVKTFRKRENKKNVKYSPAEVLAEAEAVVRRYSNIAIAGLSYTLYAFAAKEPVSINRQAVSCVLVNNAVSAEWRAGVHEDTDYSMQVLTMGYCTMIFNHLLIEKPPQMSMKGGHTDVDYADHGYKTSVGLARMWPGIFEVGLRNGKYRNKPSRVWSRFPQRPKLRE